MSKAHGNVRVSLGYLSYRAAQHYRHCPVFSGNCGARVKI